MSDVVTMLKRRVIPALRELRPMTIIGSGLTAGPPYDMPSMGELGDRVSAGLNDLPTLDRPIVERFDTLRAGVGYEKAIADIVELDPFDTQIVEIVHATITVGDLLVYERLIHDRPTTSLGRYISMLQQSTDSPAVFVTSNYDRVIEYECGRQKVPCYTGFSGGYICEYGDAREPYRPSIRRGGSSPRGIDLYKVHGSLGWFQNDAGVWRLPLQSSPQRGLSPMMIVPGKRKFEETHYSIYRQLLSAVDKKIKDAASVLAVGYGFNDPHLHEPLLERVASSTRPLPIIILVRTVGAACRDFINQCMRYVVLSQDHGDTRIECDELSRPYTIPDCAYWSLDGLMEILEP